MSKTNSAAETLQKAFQLHQAGQLDKADRLYSAVLKKQPDNGNALNLKGVIASTQGRHKDALALLERATTVLPTFADAHFNKANSLKALDRNDEALATYATAIALKPAYTDARLNAGTLLQKMGRIADAIDAFRDMARIAPADSRGHYNLGVCLTEILIDTQGDAREAVADEAENALKRALALVPNDANVHFAAANLHAKRGDHNSAIQFTQNAIKLKPNWPEAHANLGEMLRKEQRYEEAVEVLRHAAALRPDDIAIQYNLGTALSDAKEYEDAEKIFVGIIKTDSTFVKAYINLGIVYRKTKRNEEALDLFENALSLDPNLHQAYANIGGIFSDYGWMNAALPLYDKTLSLKKEMDALVLLYRGAAALSLGRLSEGWPQYEYRFDAPDEKLPRRSSPPVYWGGEDLRGKSVVVWTEQGLGDEVLHASILPEVVKRAAHCTIECSKRMAPVFARSFPSAAVVGYEASNAPVTPAGGIDYQIPLASLGRHFRPDLASFPRHDGYLKADPDKVAALRARYEALAGGRRIVGLSWRSKNERAGEAKSMALSELAPILQVPGVMFVNLQYGDCSAELADARARFGIEIVQDAAVDPLADMDMFFAQVAAMDLVLSTSNTTAHVAGAQNTPVWVLLPHGSKGLIWYWFLRREDSPWYPAARLIRADHKLEEGQARWLELTERTAADLTRWAGAQR